jgi:hypothetical protein
MRSDAAQSIRVENRLHNEEGCIRSARQLWRGVAPEKQSPVGLLNNVDTGERVQKKHE